MHMPDSVVRGRVGNVSTSPVQVLFGDGRIHMSQCICMCTVSSTWLSKAASGVLPVAANGTTTAIMMPYGMSEAPLTVHVQQSAPRDCMEHVTCSFAWGVL